MFPLKKGAFLKFTDVSTIVASFLSRTTKLPFYSPHGFASAPKKDSTILVHSYGESGDEVGLNLTLQNIQVNEGDTVIYSDNAKITLSAKGDILLESNSVTGNFSSIKLSNGKIFIEGDLYINSSSYSGHTHTPGTIENG